MAAGWRKQIPAESLLQLRQRLDRLPYKSPERAAQVRAKSELRHLRFDGISCPDRIFETSRGSPHGSRRATRAAEIGTGALL